ncbi:hypothetical protein BWQ96_05505 [Gracilariopsis chorda]|uniref:Uncharacterized protein n=1 Tax=Gracilariopsis chorda TaxID=448386 RepID=A0A2V3IRJ5_9FLOR|nr:hypothetical protein BWQ96_05505 [Gracilariopsis chorda]|eukprot:PXF44746.1 hypothetical protein BWQ96_05505 [Gracilariopsis chorda]
MPGAENLVIQRGSVLDLERICSAIQSASVSETRTSVDGIQVEVLAELRACRAQIAYPLDPSADKLPSPEDRSRLSNIGEGSIILGEESVLGDGSTTKSVTRLGADLVSVAIALSDELQVNELDAAVLLFDARTRASHRPDHDVVAAAKELYALRRRQNVQYLQEVIRAALLTPSSIPTNDENFVSLLMRERDVLVVEHQVFSNLARRLYDGFEASKTIPSSTRDQRGLFYGEYILLAETLFLLAYTVQLTSAEALALRHLLDAGEQFLSRVVERDRSHSKPSRIGFSIPPLQDAKQEDLPTSFSENVSREVVEAEGVCNLLLLAWMTALDRSRYHDMYDPRTGLTGVNTLLKDLSFIPRTNGMPAVGDDDKAVRSMPKRIAAAELVASVFRLAVASPDEEESVGTFLRTSAYAGALSFMSQNISSWIESRGGSLSPDQDLYADVLEDLSLDIAEAGHLVGAVIQFSQNEVYAAASEAAYASLEGGDAASALRHRQGLNNYYSLSNQYSDQTSGRKGRAGILWSNTADPGREAPSASYSFGSKPPKQTSVRNSGRPASFRDSFVLSPAVKQQMPIETNDGGDRGQQKNISNVTTSENLIASLSTFVARAIALAPSKLTNDSIGGGLRYWVGIGQANLGFIPRIGDAVTDLWDASMRNAYASGGVGQAFREALESFLVLLKNTSLKNGSPTHAAAALRYLCQGGHPVVSLERTSDAMSYIHGQMTRTPSGNRKELDNAEAEALRGIIDVLAHAAEAVSAQSGVLPILGDAGKELPMRLAALATLEIPAGLKETLLHALQAIGNRKAICLLMKSFARDKAALLRRFIRSVESQTGTYDVTIRVLEITNDSIWWSNDEVPESAVESIITWFAIEEVLMYWSRRKYSVEAHRWKLIHTIGSLIISNFKRDTSVKSSRLLARLLTPAPGTGAASYALKAVFYASGLKRTCDEIGNLGANQSVHHNARGLHKISGKSALNHAAEHGMGDSFREMQRAVQVSSVLNSMLLSVPPGRIAVPGVVVAPASALIFGEISALISASTLVFLANGFYPSIYKAGYSPMVCASVLAMLAKACQESYQIGIALTKDSPGRRGSASQFRSSLADLISQSSADLSDTNQSDANNYADQTPPLMHSALRIVEATLGIDGGGAPGLFLLGLQSDAYGRYTSAEYGVLGALLELVAGSLDTKHTLDAKTRATAATFLERLAANTTRYTSLSVLEHIREVGEENVGIRGSGFGDEMLFRILEAYGNSEPRNYIEGTNWSALAETMASCLRLSALHTRIFRKFELENIANSTRNRTNSSPNYGIPSSSQWESLSCLPSPLELLRTLSVITSSGELQCAFEGFRAWYLLFGTRVLAHEIHTGYSSVPLLLEIANVLLDAIASADSNRGLSTLVRKDGGEIAAAAVLLCVKRLRDCANSATQDTPNLIGDMQYGSLLNGIVRALSGTVGVGANAVRARTALYGAFIVCGPLSQRTGSEDVLSTSLGGRFGQRHVSGTEGIIAVACKDAISAPTPAARCAAITAVAVTTYLDPTRAVPALGSQNRLNRVIQYSLLNSDVQNAIIQAYASYQVSKLYEYNSDHAAVASVDSTLSLIHAVAASGHGAGVLADSGCVEALKCVLKVLGQQESQGFSKLFNDVSQESENTASKTNEDVRLLDRRGRAGTVPENRDSMIDVDVSHGAIADKHHETPKSLSSLLVALTKTLGAVVCCGGPSVQDAAVLALNEGMTVYMDILRNGRIAKKDQLEVASSLGMILSRIPEHALESATVGSLLRLCLASLLPAILPATSKTLRPGASSSLFSVGINLVKPVNTREARRLHVAHPEGGSLHERDIIAARAVCLKNVLAALRDPDHVLHLFIPQISGDLSSDQARSSRKGFSVPNVMGKLSDVLRLCKASLQEFQRSTSESIVMERSAAGDTGSALSTKKLQVISAFCREQYKVDAEPNKPLVMQECLKKAVAVADEHSDVCFRSFESCLLVLREYIRCAQETSQGRTRRDQAPSGIGGKEDTDLSSPGMGFEEAQRLLEDAAGTIVPLCKDIEGLQDNAWSGRDPSFAKQVCRQIRTGCSVR